MSLQPAGNPAPRFVMAPPPARLLPPAPLLRHVTVWASPAWEGATEWRVDTCDATATPVPGRVRHVNAREAHLLRPGAVLEDPPFRVEAWTTEFEDGTATTDFVWVRGHYALVVAISDRTVVFVRQYKRAAEEAVLGLPWGGIERNETPLEAGRRELEEETGYSFDTAEVHGPFYDLPDKSTGGHWVVVARNAYPKAKPSPDEGEFIFSVERIPVDEIWQHRVPVLMHVGALRLAGF